MITRKIMDEVNSMLLSNDVAKGWIQLINKYNNIISYVDI